MTLTQIVNRIEQLVTAHYQLHHVYYGSAVRALDAGDITYPAVFIDVQRSNIDRGQKQHFYAVELTVCDLVKVAADARANELETQSDLAQICEDLAASVQYEGWDDWTAEQAGAVQYFRDKFNADEVATAVLTFNIATLYRADRCRVPSAYVFEEAEAEQVSNPIRRDYRTYPYIYEGQGTEGASLTLPRLVGTLILNLVKGDKIHAPVTDPDATLAPGQYRHNPNTGGLEFGNDIEQENIYLIYRNT